jgi:hypothetical protein
MQRSGERSGCTGIVDAILRMMSTNGPPISPPIAARLDDLAWMVGRWTGTLGEQTVEEDWSSPKAGSMATMVRLSSANGIDTIELIVIREADDTLVLHLRQFSPSLELRLAQDMPLATLEGQSVSFLAEPGAVIKAVGYRQEAADQLMVDVTIVDGTVVTAELGAIASNVP